jgi:transcriptional regulator with XRE-family HTH domain
MQVSELRLCRLRTGLSLEALARAAGISPAFLSQIERGHRTPSLPVALRLAEGLGTRLGQRVDVRRLFTNERRSDKGEAKRR